MENQGPLPQRIISLVPSQTELLFDLGLGDRVVGITKFCVRPAEWYQSKTRIGGTKTVNIPKVLSLKPDLVLANKEENVQEQVDALAQHCPVWTSDIKTLTDALTMIAHIGQLTGTQEKAQAINEAIQIRFDQLAAKVAVQEPVAAAYLIWRKPYMAAGGDTFIHEMLSKAGFLNVFGDQMRYPECSADQLAALNPGYILLSSEPYPFAEKHIASFREICPEAKVIIVDGEMFSWYGSRLLYAPEYFMGLG
jgi:ABC-type Fe3+-hydroxamate transport system substrate-binding protein